MSRAILALALLMPHPHHQQGSAAEVAYYLDRLGSSIYLEREEATSILARACLQRKENIAVVGQVAVDGATFDIRWRAWAVVRKVDPCEVCRGTGLAEIDLDCGSYRIKRGTWCQLCEGTGSLWRPGQKS